MPIAAVHPASTRLGIVLVGALLFIALATVRRGRPVPTASLVTLTILVVFWMFGATLVWGARHPTMIRWDSVWTQYANAWQWSALLAVACAGVICVAAALRASAHDRPRLAWTCAALGFALFIGWSVVVRFATPIAAITAGIAVAALTATAPLGPARIPAQPEQSPPAKRAGRVPAIAGTTLLALAWLSFAFLFLFFHEGENVSCDCWADNQHAWQYTAQFFVAVAGIASLAVAASSYLRFKRSSLVAGGIATVIALGGWIAFYESSRPPSHPSASAATFRDAPSTVG